MTTPWWMHYKNGAVMAEGQIDEIWLQDAPNPGGPDYILGAIRFKDGSEVVIRGEQLPAPPGGIPIPPTPTILNTRIDGDPTKRDSVLTLNYDLHTHAGAEQGSTYVWLRGAEVVSTEKTYTLADGDRNQRLTATVTPRLSTGVVGDVVSADINVGDWTDPTLPPDPDPPEGPNFRIPSEYNEVLNKPHPRGPGPINGPHPPSGNFLDVADTAPHIAKADAWNPLDGYAEATETTPFKNTVSAAHAWGAMDVVIAWKATNDPVYRDKATEFLERWDVVNPPVYLWSWLAAAILVDHLHDDLDLQLIQSVRFEILRQLDAHRVKPAGTGWHGLDWEEWTQSGGAHGFAWALLVFADGTPEWRPLWDWFGHVWFMRYAPLNWAKTIGPDGGSHPSQNYLAANTAAYLYHLHLVMGVATGLDTFKVIENGGYLYGMLEMAWQRRLPSGQDIGWGCQTNTWYSPPYWQGLPGFPNAHALAYQMQHPEGMCLAWKDGFKDSKKLSAVTRPWAAFAPESAPPEVTPKTEWRCATFGMARSGWDEDATVFSWHRGQYLLGHHRFIAPGEFRIFGGGGHLVGAPRHYGFGWQAELYHRSPLYNGLRFRPLPGVDTAPNDSYPFYTAPGVMEWLNYMDDGGPNLTGVNPYQYRPAQTPPFSADPWEDFNSRRREFQHCTPLGHGPRWESIDWTPSFQSWVKGGELLFNPSGGSTVQAGEKAHGIQSRPTRAEKWVRVLVWGSDWLLVFDDFIPSPDVTVDWDVYLHGGALSALEDGLLYLDRAQMLESVQGGWPHVAAPATRRAGNLLRLDGELWIRRVTGQGTYDINQSPEHWFANGVRMYPHPGQTLLDDGNGPDDWASTRLRMKIKEGQGPVAHLFTVGGEEKAFGFQENESTWEFQVGAEVVDVSKVGYQVTFG